MRPRLYRDILHGQIRLTRADAVDLKDSERSLGYLTPRLRETLSFQRMRGIRQNGLTNFVFGCMEHSRFVHSIGVFDLSRTMYDKVALNSGIVTDPTDRTAVALAGLLHDVGHGPFSHTLEEALKTEESSFDHEALSSRFLLEDDEIGTILRDYDASFPEVVERYINKRSRASDHWTYRIVSSQLDADRIDYMLRDARMAGLQGHGFDLERLLDMMSVEENLRIVVDEHAMEAVEAFLLMNLHLYRIAYFHETVRGANALLIGVIQRAFDLIRAGRIEHLELVPPALSAGLQQLLERGSGIDLALYKRLTEHQFWSAFDEWSQPHPPEKVDVILQDLCRRLASRRPMKSFEIDVQDPAFVTAVLARASAPMAQRLGCTPEEVLSYYLIQDRTERTSYKPTMGNPNASIWIKEHNGRCTPVEKLSTNMVFVALQQKDQTNRLLFPREFEQLVMDAISEAS